MIAKVKQIETLGSLDGPGIRTVIFFQGCPLRCIFCHNPEMWDANDQAKEFTPEELFNLIKKYKSYYGTNGGVTFSGGEPLLQARFLTELAKYCHKDNINVTLDTSGCVYTKEVEDLIEDIDLVLLDIKGINKENYYNITNGTIDNFNKFLKLLESKNKKIWLRIVIMPNINDNIEYIKELANYIKPIKNVERIDLLPYHKIGDSKYEELNINNPLKDTEAMDTIECKRLEDILKDLLK